MRIHRLNPLQLTSLTMVLVLVAPAQPPPVGARRRMQVAQARKPPAPLTPRGVALQIARPLAGQSTTVLPDGATLTLGGVAVSGPMSRALVNGRQASSLNHARAYQS